MAEWLVEQGIGEDRAILVIRDRIVAAQVDWHEPLRPGAVVQARLESKPAGKRRGTAILADGARMLVDQLPATATEGQSLLLTITRTAIAERGRHKLAQARPAPAGASEGPGPSLFDALSAGSVRVRGVRPADGLFDRLGWDDLVEEALSGTIAFPGGSLQITPTPAMTVIDIDGTLAPPQLALAAVPALAAALVRLDIGGNVGIDFPTLAEKAQRQAVDAALAEALAGWSGERTAMNGFGFVQLVSRLERPSLVARYQRNPQCAGAQTALRRAESLPQPGAIRIAAHPALQAQLGPAVLEELTRRTGREIRLAWDAALALTAPSVQAVAP